MLQKFISIRIKKKIRLLQRSCSDFIHGKKFASYVLNSKIGHLQKKFEIPVREGQFYVNKIQNLKLVSMKMDGLIIQPKEYFSFWKLVGEPSTKNGLKEGRNLINGKISSDIGGGICQYSSLLYFFMVNIEGIEIIEHHPHSLDIYKENERVLPLGGDATVSYGFKDFQFRNNLSFAIQLKTKVINNYLELQLFAIEDVNFKKIDFRYFEVQNGVTVETLLDENIFSKHFYTRL